MSAKAADFVTVELVPEQITELLKGQELDLAEVVTRHLWDGMVGIRRNAAMALRLAGDRELAPDESRLLAVATKDMDAAVREHSLRALGSLKATLEEALPALLRGLADGVEAVRAAAWDGLDTISKRHGDVLIPHLIRSLFDPQPEVRLAAVELLAAKPEAARPLVEALLVPEPSIRRLLMQVLLRLGRAAVRALLDALREPLLRTIAGRILSKIDLDAAAQAELHTLAETAPDEDVRHVAAEILGRLGAETAERVEREAGNVPVIPIEGWGERELPAAELDQAAAGAVETTAFVRALRDGRAPARAAAAGVLQRRARTLDASAAFRLAALARDPELDVRRAGVAALAEIGGEGAVAPLLAASADPTVAEAALAGLQRMGPAAIGWILDEARAGQPPAVAAAALAVLGGPGAAAVAPLAAALDGHPAPAAREQAARALEAIGAAGAAALPSLLKALRDPSDGVRRLVARALGAIAGTDEAVLAALAEARRGGSPEVRKAAAKATARITRAPEEPELPPSKIDGSLSPEQAEALVKSGAVELADVVRRDLWSGAAAVRRNAALVVRLFGARPAGPEILRLVAVATRDLDPEVRAQTLLALGNLEGPIEMALPPLLRGLSDGEELVQAAARDGLEALVRRAKAELVPHLVRALFDPQPEVRIAAADLLAQEPESAGPLVATLIFPDRSVQRLTRQVLLRLGSAAARALVKALTEPVLRTAAARLLGQLPDVDADSRAALEKLAASEDEGVRQAAADVLERLGSDDQARRAREAGEVPVIPIEGWTERVFPAAELDTAAGGKIETSVFMRGLRDGSAAARVNAAGVLARRGKGDGAVAFRLAALVRDAEVDVRHAGIEALAAVGTDAAVGPLLAATGDALPAVADAARAALLELGAPAAAWILDEVRGAQSPALHLAAIEALRGYGKDAVAAVATALEQHVSPQARELAATALEGMAGAAAALPALLRALRDSSDEVRGAAAWTLGTIAATDDAVLAALAEAHRESSGAVRRAAARATAQLTREPEVVLPPSKLDRVLTAEQAEALVKGGEVELDDVVRRELWSGDAGVRKNAALVIRLFGARAIGSEQARLVAVATRDLEPEVRAQTLIALGRLDGPIDLALPALLRGLADGVETVRAAARDGLDALAARVKTALIPHLIRALLDPLPEVRTAAADLLAQQDDSAEPLVEALVYPDKTVRNLVIGVLVRLGAAAMRALVRALRNPVVRTMALRLLWQLPGIDAESKDELGKMASGDTDEAVRAAALEALERLGSEGTLREINAQSTLPDIAIDGWSDRALSAAELDAAAAGDTPTGDFVRGLRDGRSAARQNAVGVIARRARGDAAQAGALARAMALMVRDHADDVRQAAVQSVIELGQESAVDPLLSAVSDLWPAVGAAAREGLEKLGPKAAGWILDTLSSLQPDATLVAAVDVLAGYGKPVVAALATALEGHASPTAREVAAAALERLGAVAAPGVPAMLKALRDPGDEVRVAAARALATAGDESEEVVAALMEARRERNAAVRRAAAAALLRLRPEPAPAEAPPIPIDGFAERPLGADELSKNGVGVAAFTAALLDGRPLARLNAAVALAGKGKDAVEATGPLALRLRDSEPAVRKAAAEALGRVAGGDDGNAAVRALSDALLDADAGVAEAATKSLRGLGETAVSGLAAALDLDPALAAVTVVTPLAAHGATAVPLLIKALEHPSVRTRANAAATLAAMGRGPAEPAREALKAAARDGSALVRMHVREALEVLDQVTKPPRTLPAVPIPFDGFEERELSAKELGEAQKKLGAVPLMQALGDGREVVRRNAARALGGLRDEGVVIALGVGARDPDPVVRAAACASLGKAAAGEEARNAVMVLVDAMLDPARAVREEAGQALAELGPAALPGLLAALDRDPGLAAYTVLPALASGKEPPVEAIGKALAHGSVRVRANAAAALASLAPGVAEPAREALQAAWLDPHELVRAEARRALIRLDGLDVRPPEPPPEPIPVEGFEERFLEAAEIGTAVPVARLTRALGDGRSVVRRNAAVALGALGTKAGEATGEICLALRDVDAAVRLAAAEALARGGRPEAAAPALAGAVVDPDAAVARAAQAGLDALGEKVIEGLAGALDRDPRVAEVTIVPALAALGKAAAPALAGALAHASVRVRANAAEALARLGKGDGEAARAALGVAAGDADDLVRARARKALNALDGVVPAPRFGPPVPVPVEGFGDGPLPLDTLKKHAKVLDVETLGRLIFDGHKPIRENAARALQVTGGGVDQLLLALKDFEGDVRAAAAESLAALKTDPERTVPALATVLFDGGAAEHALRGIVAFGKAAVEPLVGMLGGRPGVVVKALARVAPDLGGELLTQLAAKLAPAESMVVRENAADALGAIGKGAREAVPALLAALRDIEVPFRAKVVRAIGTTATLTPEIQAVLETMREKDERASVQAALKEALRNLISDKRQAEGR